MPGGMCGVVWKESNSARYADEFCCRDVTLIVTVMLAGWANIVPFGTMVSPGCLLVFSVVYHYFSACWGQVGVTEIEIAIDFCRYGRTDTGRPQEIQCDNSLWDKKVPTI